MLDDVQRSGGPTARPVISAHFVNNVLAAAASYIDDDPEYARDVIAELGQFFSYALRDDTGPVSAAQELAHVATYLRLQQARFPERLTIELPDAADLIGRVPPGAIRLPLGDALAQRLRQSAAPCTIVLRAVPGGVQAELSGSGTPDVLTIPLEASA